jgi:hypothetical protein
MTKLPLSIYPPLVQTAVLTIEYSRGGVRRRHGLRSVRLSVPRNCQPVGSVEVLVGIKIRVYASFLGVRRLCCGVSEKMYCCGRLPYGSRRSARPAVPVLVAA